MAGFYVVGMMFVLIMLLAVIMWAFEIISILSIVFSAISLGKSNKYAAYGGRYDYRSVKRFHTVSVVFFVLGCIGAAVTGIGVLALFTDYTSVGSYFDDPEALLSMLIMGVVSAGKYVVVLILGIKAFKRFAAAKDLHDSICASSAVFCSQRVNPYVYGRNPAYYQGTNGFGTQPTYTGNPTGGLSGNQGAFDGTGNSFGSADNASESVNTRSNVGLDAEKKEASAENGDNNVFGDTIPDKICPKCGCSNSGLYKYCTLCGEKL